MERDNLHGSALFREAGGLAPVLIVFVLLDPIWARTGWA